MMTNQGPVAVAQGAPGKSVTAHPNAHLLTSGSPSGLAQPLIVLLTGPLAAAPKGYKYHHPPSMQLQLWKVVLLAAGPVSVRAVQLSTAPTTLSGGQVA